MKEQTSGEKIVERCMWVIIGILAALFVGLIINHIVSEPVKQLIEPLDKESILTICQEQMTEEQYDIVVDAYDLNGTLLIVNEDDPYQWTLSIIALGDLAYSRIEFYYTDGEWEITDYKLARSFIGDYGVEW